MKVDQAKFMALQMAVDLCKVGGIVNHEDVVKAAERYHAFLTGATYAEKPTVKDKR